MKHHYLLSLVFTFLVSIFWAGAQTTVIVAKDGSGNYTTLKDAINAYPTTGINASNPFVILVKRGYYFEKDTISSTKPFIQIIGEDVANTIIAFNATAGLVPPSGVGTFGTSGSATLIINANDFTAENITFSNTFNYDSAVAAGFAGTQAVAVYINADRSAFKNCRFLGNQDTLWANGSLNARQYFKDCYIDGIVDFIFGNSIAVFDSCVIYPKTRNTKGAGNSYITAARTTAGQAYGYVFRNCTIPSNTGGTLYFLGRPWGNATGSSAGVHNRVTFLNTLMGNSIDSLGWSLWDASTITDSIFNAEFQSMNLDGTPKDVSHRVSWSHQLKSADTVGYNLPNLFSGWNPNITRPDFAVYQDPGLVISNFVVKTSNTISTFKWNISWVKNGITYQLFRATTVGGTFTPISQVTAVNDTAINFSLTDATPPAGSIYSYYVVASLAGYTPDTTAILQVSTAPTVSISGTIGSFIQSLNPPAPSATQSFTLSGVNLVGNITITPPVNFEVSLDGINWFTNSNPLVLTFAGSTVTSTTIMVRLNASIIGASSGNIVCSTTGLGAIGASIAVSGNTTNDVLLNYVVLQQWPLTSNNQDSSAARVSSLIPTVPTLNNLYLSNGTQVTNVPAYSAAFGQALSGSPAGDGFWTTAKGGPGSTLNRSYYEQFVITAASGKSVRIDSLILNTAEYFTASGKMAISFSKSGFVSDSTAIVSIASSYTLPNLTSANTNTLRYALNGANGDTIPSDSSLTIRLYFTCGSGTAGRYSVVKNLYVKGAEIASNLPINLVSFTGNYTNGAVKLSWSTAKEENTKDFILERSNDDKLFTTLNSIVAANKSGVNNYNYTDDSPLTGTSYYRLKMLDNNGSYTFSKVISINSGSSTTLSLFPNPVHSTVTVKFPTVTKGAQLSVIDVNGRRVTSYLLEEGITQKQINTNSLAKGIYTLELESKGIKTTFRFAKAAN